MSRRRTAACFGFVNWPEADFENLVLGENRPERGVVDTREGGMECWLIVADAARASDEADQGGSAPTEPASVRDVCITGFCLGVTAWDAVPDDWFENEWEHSQRYWRRMGASERKSRIPRAVRSMFDPMAIEAAVCIGATGQSLWDYGAKNYWKPSLEGPDLKDEGLMLYRLLETLYGYGKVHIVMVLDT